MSENTKQQKNLPETSEDENNCGFSQKQARLEMKKEDERKQINNMMKKF